MANDRFINWTDIIPTAEQINMVIEDYIGGAAKIEQEQNLWYINFSGPCSFALKRVSEINVQELYRDQRWIEVFLHDDCVDVLTREQDEFINAIADGLAEIFTRYWNGQTRN